jgi:hypothetical protein
VAGGTWDKIVCYNELSASAPKIIIIIFFIILARIKMA